MEDVREAGAQAAGERRHVTVVFSDLSGYTAMCEELDPEDVHDVLSEIFTAAEKVIVGYGGRIDRLLGDAVMAVFGDPVSHEDDAERAVRAALDLHAVVDELAPSLQVRTGHPLRLHTGINSGVVITGGRVSDGSSGPLGDTVNLAARLDGLASAGEILLGPTTAELVKGVFDLDAFGMQTVKGKADPIAVARVAGLARTRSAPSRRHGDFVGRHEELGILLGALERVRDGVSGAITVVGDAGAGKTRLLTELREQAGEHVQWLEGRAYAFGDRIPYAPVIDLIGRVVGIEEGDSAEKVLRKLTDAATNLAPEDVDSVLGPLSRLYAIETADEAAIDREVFHPRLVAAATRVVEALARRGPTVVAIQDLHWADPPTIALLRDAIGSVRAPVLTICNTRPGFALDVGERVIELSDLSDRQTRQLIGSLLDTDDPPDALMGVVEARADGNPFFVEEIVNSLIDTGALSRDETGWHVAASLDAAAVPSTIRGVIAARIDRLDASRRRVLQEAAVVGREFLYRIVNQVSDSGNDLAPSLAALEDADLIREKSPDPDLEYFFKHALTQEVAYDGLVKRERQALHEQVARAIEAELSDRSGELTETLAHHWLRAGATDEAVKYLRQAGNKAVERYALDEAHTFYDEAYQLLADRDRTRAEDRALAETLIEWMLVHYYRDDFAHGAELLARYMPVIEALDDDELTGMALAWRGNAAWIMGLVREGEDLLNRSLEVGRATDNPKVLAHAITWKLWINFVRAKPAQSIDDAEALPPLIARLEDARYVVLKSQAALGFAYASLGDAPAARKVAQELLELGQRTGSTRATSMGHGVTSFLAGCFGDYDTGIAEGRRAVAAASDPIFRATVMSSLLVGLAGANQIEAMRHEVEASRGLMSETLAILHRTADAVCLLLEGHPARGMRALEACRDDAHAGGMEWVIALLDLWVALMYARIATREVPAEIGVAFRNPGFIVRHALPARRKAHRAFEKFEADFIATGRLGKLRYLLDSEWAKLLAHEGDIAGARRHAEVALAAIADYGEGEGTRTLREFLSQLDAPR